MSELLVGSTVNVYYGISTGTYSDASDRRVIVNVVSGRAFLFAIPYPGDGIPVRVVHGDTLIVAGHEFTVWCPVGSLAGPELRAVEAIARAAA
ncbi:hypothetical protein ACWIGI_28685 [Nocardia sp. NPDC055321]